MSVLLLLIMIKILISNMKVTRNIFKEIEYFEPNEISLSKFQKELNDALNSDNYASIWQLTKMITRVKLD